MMQTEQAETILIVEDDLDIGTVISHILSEETPYEPVLVDNPLSALELNLKQPPAIFILNYRLPHMNGIELYDKLHACPAYARVPAIMVSANLPTEQIAKRGIRGLDKPIDIDEFITLIEQTIAHPMSLDADRRSHS